MEEDITKNTIKQLDELTEWLTQLRLANIDIPENLRILFDFKVIEDYRIKETITYRNINVPIMETIASKSMKYRTINGIEITLLNSRHEHNK